MLDLALGNFEEELDCSKSSALEDFCQRVRGGDLSGFETLLV